MAYRIYDEFADNCIQKREDGTYLVEAQMPEDDWLYGYLLTFGTAVEVVAPSHIRRNLIREIKKLSDFYFIN